MRAYAPISLDDLRALCDGERVELPITFSATPEYLAAHADLDEEECEYNLSQEAARASLSHGGSGVILALDLESDSSISWENVECLFQCEHDDAESDIELLWFAPSEIPHHLDEWVKS